MTLVKSFHVDWGAGDGRAVVAIVIKDEDGKLHFLEFDDREQLVEFIWALDIKVSYSSKVGEGRVKIEKAQHTIGFCHMCNNHIKKKEGHYITFGRKNRKKIGLCDKCLKLLRRELKQVEV